MLEVQRKSGAVLYFTIVDFHGEVFCLLKSTDVRFTDDDNKPEKLLINTEKAFKIVYIRGDNKKSSITRVDRARDRTGKRKS